MGELSVLVVDDEADFVDSLIKRLRRKGVDCDGAGTGAGALEKIRSHGFDTVLLDMNLADENGNDVLREIRQHSPDIRVIILTGYASASAGREGLEQGAFDYLIKPVEFETLYERLRDAFSGRLEPAKDRTPVSCKRKS